jgi:uncharacterized protein YjiS (DUF1127 family)
MHACTHESEMIAEHRGPLAGAWLAVAAYLREAARRGRERRAAAALVSLDDHLLRDIGVHRGDAGHLVRRGH